VLAQWNAERRVGLLAVFAGILLATTEKRNV
jgi:hypothetical protein